MSISKTYDRDLPAGERLRDATVEIRSLLADIALDGELGDGALWEALKDVSVSLLAAQDTVYMAREIRARAQLDLRMRRPS